MSPRPAPLAGTVVLRPGSSVAPSASRSATGTAIRVAGALAQPLPVASRADVQSHACDRVRLLPAAGRCCRSPWMARLENLLGAQALALTDRLLAADGGPLPSASPSERAALVTLLAHPDRSVSWLGGVLGLTSSGITRLVDRLVAAGWVTRTPGEDARSRRVRLTRDGHDRAFNALHARRAAMADALSALSKTDRAELERLLEVIVGSLAETRLPAMQVCRLCDRSACASDGRACPLEHTAPVEGSHG